MNVTVGTRVRHPRYGVGSVMGVERVGYARVRFDILSSTFEVATSELDAGNSSGSTGGAAPTPTATPPMDEARLCVECLRQGLPPPGELLRWTVGQTAARQVVVEAFRSGRSAILNIHGSYGHGKSHIGRMAREVADQQGIAQMHVELDGAERALANGAGLIDGLLSNLVLPRALRSADAGPGIADVLRRCSPIGGRMKKSDPFEPLLRNKCWLESEEAAADVVGYLLGQVKRQAAEEAIARECQAYIALNTTGISVFGASVEDKAANHAEYLGKVSSLALRAGARGVVVVLDEFDQDRRATVHRRHHMLLQMQQAFANLPVVMILLSTHAIHWPVPTMVALRLEPLSRADLNFLISQAFACCERAYPSVDLATGRAQVQETILKRFEDYYRRENDWGPRYVIRAAVEACEAVRAGAAVDLSRVVFGRA